MSQFPLSALGSNALIYFGQYFSFEIQISNHDKFRISLNFKIQLRPKPISRYSYSLLVIYQFDKPGLTISLFSKTFFGSSSEILFLLSSLILFILINADLPRM